MDTETPPQPPGMSDELYAQLYLNGLVLDNQSQACVNPPPRIGE